MTHDPVSLRADYPMWNFGTVWATAATGPDYRTLWASRSGVLLSARTVDGLRASIETAERAEGWPRNDAPQLPGQPSGCS